MKKNTGIIIGFIVGTAGFLALFKIIVLDRVPPEDELAPGAVLILSIISGVLCGFAGRMIQRRILKKKA